MLRKISLVVGLLTLALVIGLAIGGVGNGKYHEGTVIGKGINGAFGEADARYFLVDEGGEEAFVHGTSSSSEYYTTNIGDNITWEDRGAINVTLGSIGFVAFMVILISIILLSEDWL